MTFDQMLAAAYKFTDWLNYYWNFYVFFLAAILGWIFAAKTQWNISRRIVVTAVFLGFVVVSADALWRTYKAMDQTVLELSNLWKNGGRLKEAVLARLSNGLWPYAMALHAVGDGVVIYCIWTMTGDAGAKAGSSEA